MKIKFLKKELLVTLNLKGVKVEFKALTEEEAFEKVKLLLE